MYCIDIQVTISTMVVFENVFFMLNDTYDIQNISLLIFQSFKSLTLTSFILIELKSV